MGSKGVLRTGETYCLSCYASVDSEAATCPGCGEALAEEVKAFLCPKCKSVLALGDSQCRGCGLKFKVKTLRPPAEKKDDQFLVKLIEWGKTPVEPAGPGEGIPPEGPSAPSAEQIKRLTQLKESVKDLMANRSEMLDRMEKRLEEEKARLAQITSMEGKTESSQEVEAEIMALADEMADITMLQAHMELLSDELTTLMGSVDVSEGAKERGLAARALRSRLDEKEKELSELKAKEEALAKREEMVDRKIQSYAQKKKQLDLDEEQLKVKLAKLEMEREELEKLKAIATGARTDTEREEARAKWQEEQEHLRKRLAGMRTAVVAHRSGKEPAEVGIGYAEDSLDSMIAQVEREIAAIITEKVELRQSMTDAQAMDDDLRKLLRVLDQMLGQLPEEAIERFSKSEEFAIYEKILDRLKI